MSRPGDERRGRIVAGVDGSASSREALRWAVRQATLTGATLEAITAWQFPAFYGWAPGYPDDVDLEQLARQAQAEALDEVLGADRPAWVRPRVAEGHPAQVLAEASAGAELLVVGSRGHGGFTDAVLGSVSTYCVHHALCPVTVIRPGAHPA